MWTAIVVLVVCITSAMTSPIIDPTHRPPPGHKVPTIPTLEDLKRGVGTGDPTDHFNPIIKMENGKMKEESREQIEQYHMNYISDHGGVGDSIEEEKIRGEMAYRHLVQALVEGDQKAIAKAKGDAATFMKDHGLTLEDAEEEGRSQQNNQGGRKKRFLATMTNGYWDKCIIPYEYRSDFTDYDSVKSPMQTIEQSTGFRFVRWNASVQSLYGLSHNNRLTYVPYDGCWSYVGNLRRSGQEISCCSGSTCVHEIGHAMGFLHEQESPLRDDYLRIEWQGIDPNYWSQYTRQATKNSVLFGYYDPTSVMHYWNGGFSVNYKDTMTTLDPDRDFLMARDTKYYYYFKEAMETHQCFDLFCTESLTCENDGWPSVVGGECLCICPHSLDPKTRCATKEGTDTSLANLPWPAGSFTILNAKDGCPDGFKLGWQYHVPPNYVWGSTPYNAKPDWNWWHQEHEFCSRIDEQNNGPAWPAGTYCIYRKGGSCPAGFESGYIQMDDAPTSRTNITEGELPDGVYGENTRWEFCCRSDGPANTPIKLPIRHPFILFEKYYCQDVAGMATSSEYFNWRSDSQDGYHEFGGSLPYYYEFSTGHFNLYYCYYTPINKDCGGIFTLDASHAANPMNIQSMNYPDPYGSNWECSYTLLAPENTTLQLEFGDFDVNCGTDSLEVVFSMPGHFGRRYCGSGFEKTIVSSENYMRLTLRSGSQQGSSTGFSANIRLIDESGSCFTNEDKDRSYSGDISYTKNFEPCLPWNEVKNCRFSRFAPETFDDDLSENFCRNTGYGTGPWCYTNADTCARDYCDACSTRSCYDLFNDCSAQIAADSSFCTTNLDGQALRGCRRSCDKCKIVDTETTCPSPGTVDNITPSPTKNEYTVGDQVEYVCPTPGSNDVRTRTCTSSGTWTDLNFVCGACPEGWGMVDGKCYKWFEKYVGRDEAQTFCEDLGAGLAIITSQKQHDYVAKIVRIDIEEMEEVWIGLKEVNGEYKWDDGTSVTFDGWKNNEPDGWGDCVTFDNGGWESYVCRYSKSFVCMHTPSERTTCADQSRNCEAFIRATPDLCVRETDFAHANCPYSCGICSIGESSSIGKREIEHSACVDQSNNCEAFILTTQDFCIRQKEFAYANCMSTCNMCETTAGIGDEETCSAPGSIEGALPAISKDIYVVGEQVEYMCPDSMITVYRDCMAGGVWSDLDLDCDALDEEDKRRRWMTSADMPEPRQPVKRSFDDCFVVPPTTATSTTESTSSSTSTTESTSSSTSTTESPSSTSITESTSSSTSTTESTSSSTTSSTAEPTTSASASTSTSTTTSPPVSGQCPDPGVPGNTQLLSGVGDIEPGQIYEYSCGVGYALASGDLIRACLVTGQLTGTAPSCEAESTVEQPVNNINIRRRSRHLSSGYVYTATNQDFRITKTGKLTKWRFYSTYTGDISLQVWRFANGVTSSGQFIGENTVTDTGDDRVRTIEIPESQQISVQDGDVIAVHYPENDAAGIPYTRCSLEYEPSQNNQLRIRDEMTAPSSLVEGNSYSFVNDNYDCKTFSLNAFIK